MQQHSHHKLNSELHRQAPDSAQEHINYFSFGSKMQPKPDRESASSNRKSGGLRVDPAKPPIFDPKDDAALSPPCLQQSVSSPTENSDDGALAAGDSTRPIFSVYDVDQQLD